MRARRLVFVLIGLTLALAGCGAPATMPGPTGSLTVFADSALTETFTQMGRDLETTYPGLQIAFTFAGSNALARQIASGTPADVFAAADGATMKQATDAGKADPPTVFARDQLVIAVPKGNPGRIASLTSMATVRVALCAKEVPCGSAAATLLATADVAVTPVAEKPDVTATLAAVTSGEADAALVYRSAARAAESQVDTVEIIESVQAVNDCSIAVLQAAPNKQAAQAFRDHVLSTRGRAVLSQAGFQEP